MGAVDTTYTFTATDTITSTKMNNIIDQTTITNDAIWLNDGLEVASGKIRITGGGITSSKLGTGSVTSNAIADGTIVNADINASAAIDPSKLGSGALPTGATVTTANIVDTSITAPKLDGAQTGSAPIFGVRAWVSYNPDIPISPEFSGTYSRSGTTVTVIAAGHGLKIGSLVYLNFTSGAATDGEFIVTGVSTTTVTNDTFTVTHGTSGSTSGNVGIPRATIIGSGNVSSVTLIATGRQVINFTTEMPNANYAAVASPENNPSSTSNGVCDIASKYIGACQIRTQSASGTDFDQPTSVMVIG